MSATESDDRKLYGDLEGQGFNNEITGPVEDWATDFDHTDEVGRRPVPDPGRAPASGCPVAHTDRYGGVWLPTTPRRRRRDRLRHRALHVAQRSS